MTPAEASTQERRAPGTPRTTPSAAPARDEATRIFSTSILISGIRCTLAYVVFPWILPVVHASNAVGPWIGLVVGVVAIVFNILSIRRFWRADHRWKWPVSALNLSVLILVSILLIRDISELVS